MRNEKNQDSALPESPDYWEELAQRIRADAVEPLSALRRANASEHGTDAWHLIISHRAPWLVAAVAAAMLTVWVTLPMRELPSGQTWIARSVSPVDPALHALGHDEPPSVDALMTLFPPNPDLEVP